MSIKFNFFLKKLKLIFTVNIFLNPYSKKRRVLIKAYNLGLA